MATGREPAKRAIQQVRPLLSVSKDEARRRVLNLYKAWVRALPDILTGQLIPKNEVQAKEKIREEFLKHRDVSDVRIIDMLVIKGKMELDECVKGWKQPTHVMRYWKDTLEPKPNDFLSKFISGKN